MNNLTVSNIHGNVIDCAAAVGIENQISWQHLAGFDRPSYFCLFSGGTGQTYTGCIAHHVLYKARTVGACIGIGSTPYISSAYKLQAIVYHLAPQRCLLIGPFL